MEGKAIAFSITLSCSNCIAISLRMFLKQIKKCIFLLSDSIPSEKSQN